jgi:hypothetical protein
MFYLPSGLFPTKVLRISSSLTWPFLVNLAKSTS